ncbi:hypothetical protein [Bradyrhizobium sp. Tv2a-2]|uniref:hypothetical protein n=1 Tax=Bradyrhizobium sp. Tv2a-2 TaxID=113395 RepID=UPI000417F535|nr:hypothetical protein [Bradyrhizobium sp. Tv2a-2]
MVDAKQMELMQLPEVSAPVSETPDTPSPRPKAPRKRSKQLSLQVRLYTVESASTSCVVQAATPSAAKYAAFKRARDMGMYRYQGGFIAFVAGGCKVAEVRQ